MKAMAYRYLAGAVFTLRVLWDTVSSLFRPIFSATRMSSGVQGANAGAMCSG